MSIIPIYALMDREYFVAPPLYSKVDSGTYFVLTYILFVYVVMSVYGYTYPMKCIVPTILANRADGLAYAENYCSTHPEDLYYHNVTAALNDFKDTRPMWFHKIAIVLPFVPGLVVFVLFRYWMSVLLGNSNLKRILKVLRDKDEAVGASAIAIQPAVEYLFEYMRYRQERILKSFHIFGGYVLFKILICLWSIVVMFTIQFFFGRQDFWWTLNVIKELIGMDNDFVEISSNAICNIHALSQGTLMAPAHVSCNLPMIDFYKYSFTIYWFIFFTIAIANFLHGIFFFMHYVSGFYKNKVHNYCYRMDGEEGREASDLYPILKKLYIEYLGFDGIILFEIIEHDIDRHAAELLCLKLFEAASKKFE